MRLPLAVVPFAALALAQNYESSRLLTNANGENRAWTGVGRLTGGSTCTASFLDVGGGADAPAYVLTSGHCIDTGSTNLVRIDEAPGSRRVAFNFFRDTAAAQIAVPVRRIAYSTMKRRDTAILELEETSGVLRARGVVPLRLADRIPPPGEPVINAGTPVSGIPPDRSFLRMGNCTLGPGVNLVEFTWLFDDHLRNDCPDIKGGSSGSPLLTRDHVIVGVINTTTAEAYNAGGGFDCYLGRPCEVGPRGERVLEDTSYATPAVGLNACFAAGRFRIDAPGCALDPGRQPTLTRRTGHVGKPPAAWNVTVGGAGFTHYRYKVIPEGSGDCRAAEGYGAVRAIAAAPVIDDPLPPAEGRSYLCVVGGPTPTPDPAWQQPLHASVLHFKVDTTPPVVPQSYSLEADETAYVLRFDFAPPEISGVYWKAGPPEATDCEEPGGYRPFLRIPIRLARDQAPYRVCFYPEDFASNTGPATSFVLDRITLLPNRVFSASRLVSKLAPGMILTVEGVNLTEEIDITDSAGVRRPLRVLGVAQDRLTAVIPPETALGPATLTARREGQTSTLSLPVESLSPGFLVAGIAGVGAPAGTLLRVRPDGSRESSDLAACINLFSCSRVPIPIGEDVDGLYLILYGTGLRAARQVAARIGPQPVEVLYAGPQPTIPGLDQVNLRLPKPFRLRGYQDLFLTVDGQAANRLLLWFE